jgi:hypothetical protein
MENLKNYDQNTGEIFEISILIRILVKKNPNSKKNNIYRIKTAIIWQIRHTHNLKISHRSKFDGIKHKRLM